ncbi:transcriptional regulator [Pseudomonas aeruginosa]|uniref:helix-turn-helix domain-containing protein n=1 Tax=Pseudomonas aeruginosa TaxID=287 RepID=UPI000FC416D2|nr:helix-turn-helix domain-containing protein [Pseudomonas aeruginosa]RUI34575.1 nucleotide excision repair protein [Pseudomonas aeruginosa]
MNSTDIPSDANVRWEWIKYQLRVRGISLADLARSLEVTSQAVKNAKRTPYPRVERAIAEALELSPRTLWPERWRNDESPKRQRPNRAETLLAYDSYAKNTKYAVQAQRKNDVGA